MTRSGRTASRRSSTPTLSAAACSQEASFSSWPRISEGNLVMAETATINAWRLKTEGPLSWGDRLVTGAKNKYFMVSADSHANEPIDFLTARITDPEYQDRLPRVVVDDEGISWMH